MSDHGDASTSAAECVDCHCYCMSDGRKYYVSEPGCSSGWIPPMPEAWHCTFGLPYGWEMAVDTSGKLYYINHQCGTTTYNDPRVDLDSDVPEPRQVLIERDPNLGYGFVAGSERPVIVRFVTEGHSTKHYGGGPSVNKLLPGDEILFVNGEDVADATKDTVVHLVSTSPFYYQ